MAVGTLAGPKSATWRVFSSKNEVYLARRGPTQDKFSFHKSRICRHAFTEKHGPAIGMDDRLMHRWKRKRTPPAGGGHGSAVVSLLIPTDFLSTAIEKPRKAVHWITPAPAGMSIVIDIFYCRDPIDQVRALCLPENRSIVGHAELPNGENIYVTSVAMPYAGEEFRLPAAGSRTFDFMVARVDTTSSGRPARITRFNRPKNGDRMFLWEFGAFRVARIELSDVDATLTSNKIIESTDWTLKK